MRYRRSDACAARLIQRFGWYGIPAALNLNIHFHILFLDGVYLYRGMLWLQTDDNAYTDVTNSMMLAAIPGSVGDGSPVEVAGADGLNITTYAGAAPGENMQRFLVGVPGSEIAGVEITPDNRTMFVIIQHPGEFGSLANLHSSWPSPSGNALDLALTGQRPRTATTVITRDDGGEIAV